MAGLLYGQRLDLCGHKTHLVYAEPRLDLAYAAVEQRQDAPGIAQRPGKAQFHLARFLIDPAQGQAKHPRARLLRLQPGAEPFKQAGGSGHDIVGKADGVGQGHPHAVMGRFGQRGNRFGLAAKGLIQPHQQIRPEAAGQRRARRPLKIADRAQPQPLQGGAGFLLQPQRRDGKMRQHVKRPARFGKAFAVMGQCPCRPARIAQPDPRGKARPAQPLAHVGQHRRLAAEQMRRPGDVQHQPVIALQPDPGAIARGPTAQHMQKARIADGVRRAALQIGAKGARIGIGHSPAQPVPFGRAVEAMNTVGIGLPERQDERAVNRARPQNPVARQPGKPYRDDATLYPIEHARHPMFPICS